MRGKDELVSVRSSQVKIDFEPNDVSMESEWAVCVGRLLTGNTGLPAKEESL